jgi:hypothetical protein
MANHKTAKHKVEPITALTKEAWLPGAEAWWSAMAECQNDMLDFMSRRFAKDADAVREMSICRNRAEASAIHWKWVEDTFRDYSSEAKTEAKKMTAIYAKNAADMAQDIAQKSHPRP